MKIQKIICFRTQEEFINWQKEKKRRILKVDMSDLVLKVLFEENESVIGQQKFSIEEIRVFAYKWLKKGDEEDSSPQAEIENERLLAFMDYLDRTDSKENIEEVLWEEPVEELLQKANQYLTVGVPRLGDQ